MTHSTTFPLWKKLAIMGGIAAVFFIVWIIVSSVQMAAREQAAAQARQNYDKAQQTLDAAKARVERLQNLSQCYNSAQSVQDMAACKTLYGDN